MEITQCEPAYAEGYICNYHIPSQNNYFYYSQETDLLAIQAQKKLAMCFIILAKKKVSKVIEREQKKWYYWLFSNDFVLWCDSAGRDPKKVQKRALEIYKHGFDFDACKLRGKYYATRKRYRKEQKSNSQSF